MIKFALYNPKFIMDLGIGSHKMKVFSPSFFGGSLLKAQIFYLEQKQINAPWKHIPKLSMHV